MKLLFVAFINVTHKQLLRKINDQFKAFKRFNPETNCVVIGQGGGTHDFSIYDFQYLNLDKLRNNSDPAEDRSLSFNLLNRHIQENKYEVIYFRYPGGDHHLLEFMETAPNVIFEHHSNELKELINLNKKMFETEKEYGPKVLEHAIGVVAGTREIVEFEQSRVKKDLPGFVMTNGVNIDEVPIVQPVQFQGKYQFMFLSNYTQPWQGVDRFVNGLVNCPDRDKILIHMFGKVYDEYLDLINSLNLRDNFKFWGYKEREEIGEIANRCQGGIGQLGVHRKGLKGAPILKHREYCLRGLPFIYSGEDPDFPGSLPFTHVAESNDDPIDFGPLVRLANNFIESDDLRFEIRSYAESNLSWYKKTKEVLSFFESLSDGRAPSVKKPVLALVCPQLGAPSETFIRKHIDYIFPGRTVVLTGSVLDKEWFPGPTKIIPIQIGEYSFGKKLEAEVLQFLQQHSVTHILCEFGSIGAPIIELNRRTLRLPIFVHFHGQDSSEFLRRPDIASYYRRMGKIVDGIITVSKPMTDRLTAIGIPKEKIQIIHSGVDINLESIATPEKPPCRFISVARLVPKKGVLQILKAFEKAKRSVHEITLDIVGDGPLRDELESYIKHKNLTDSVKMHGQQPHEFVLKMLDRSSAFVLPSVTDPETGNKEGLPVTILEASAHGLPVLSTFHEGIPEAIEHTVTGFLTEEGDSDELANYMVQLAKDGPLRKKMGLAGRNKILSDGFTVDAMVQSLRSFIRVNSNEKIKNAESRHPSRTTITRVMFVNHNLYPFESSGTPISTFNHASGMVEMGMNVAVLIPSADTKAGYEKQINDKFTLYKVPRFDKYKAFFDDIDPRVMSEYMNSIRVIIEDFAPDIVHINDYAYMPAEVISVFHDHGVRVVRSVCNMEELCHMDSPVISNGSEEKLCSGPESPEKCAECFFVNKLGMERSSISSEESKEISGKIEKRFDSVRTSYSGNVDGVIFAEKAFQDYFTNFVNIPENLIRVIPRGFRFDYARIDLPRPVQGNIVRFGYVGHLIFSKGTNVLLNAFEEIATTEDFRLDLYGGIGPKVYRDRIAILEKNFPTKIRYNGEFDKGDLVNIANSIDMAIVPSNFDTYNRVVRELLYLGVPQIVTDFFGSSVIHHDVNGLKVPVGDHGAMAEMMKLVINNPNMVHTLSEGAIRAKIPTLEEEVHEMLEFYYEIVGKPELDVKYGRDILDATKGAVDGQITCAISPEQPFSSKGLFDGRTSKVSAAVDLKIQTRCEELYRRATTLIEAGKADDAIAVLQEILAIDQYNSNAMNDLAVLHSLRGEYESSIEILKRLIMADPSNSVGLRNLAKIYIKKERLEDGMRTYLEVLKTCPSDVETLLIVAKLCLVLGINADALRFFTSVLELEPNNEEASEQVQILRGSMARQPDQDEAVVRSNCKSGTEEINKMKAPASALSMCMMAEGNHAFNRFRDDARSEKASMLPSQDEFDEESYLELNPDVAQGLRDGKCESGWDHFINYGFDEGRKWLKRRNSSESKDSLATEDRLPSKPEFDEDKYLAMYPDVAEGILKRECTSGWEHFIKHGFEEGRCWFKKKVHHVTPDSLESQGKYINKKEALHGVDVPDFEASSALRPIPLGSSSSIVAQVASITTESQSARGENAQGSMSSLDEPDKEGGVFPIPPAELRYRIVSKKHSEQEYLQIGRNNSLLILDYWKRYRMGSPSRVLDLGCGCGRILRFFLGSPLFHKTEFHGCDIDAPAIEWCKRNLPGNYFLNNQYPPLIYRDKAFDLIYVLSVFTHIDQESQRKWLKELKRILSDDGILLVSVNGEFVWNYHLSNSEGNPGELNQKGFVFVNNIGDGVLPEWYQTSFNSKENVQRQFGEHFQHVQHVSKGLNGFQDLVVLSKKVTDNPMQQLLITIAEDRIVDGLRQVRELLAQEPHDAQAHYIYAQLLHSEGNFEASLIELRQVLDINPNHAGAHNDIGVLYFQQGKVREAYQHFQEATSLEPQSNYLYNYGMAQLQLQKIEEAHDTFRLCHEINPDDQGASSILKKLESVLPAEA